MNESSAEPIDPAVRTHLARVARMVGADLVESATGIDVQRDGRTFARVRDGRLELHSGAHPGSIAIEAVADAPGWWRVETFPAGVTFRRGPDLLRDAFEQAARRAP